MNIADLQAWLPSAIAAGALGLVWNDIRRTKDNLRRSLYRDDGTTIYIPRGECERDQGTCRQSVFAQMQTIQNILSVMDAKRDAERGQTSTAIAVLSEKINTLVGRFEQDQVERQRTRGAGHGN